jgi:Tfp pilus assembly protein PilF
VETLLLLARVCEVERRERCVREAFERAERVAPKDPRPDLLWADMRERVGDVGGAEESVARAHHKAPEDALIAVRYARLLSETGQYAEAETVLRGLSSTVAAPKLLVELGLVRVKQGRDEEAREFFQRAVEQQPRFAVGHYYLGLTQHRLGREVEAEEELRTADRLDQADWRALAALCSVQVRTGQREAARATRMDLERRFPERMDVIRDTCRLE